ncbi:hypothetical protein PICMEDRAFT_72027 [Pichia membranifaciens NRRL Y-2026]|uniref:Macro domain-containing protein n=1 Tax=Pichia membranifaciens NRRL Y-2026 TaxID=763406 RepID=A0A1E3NPK8_9ASCO|nr:hypothetical protein PICMEDRAFT_72027 [Pichia membranifaciens NRRL Y-2026]ODQ48029.1 hypothetical protein PICMEDRAFT_72027 [Pichia membranifaciens NRRL Y-2026]
MSKLKVILVDSNPFLIDAWSRQLSSAQRFSKLKFPLTLTVETHRGKLATVPIEGDARTAIVSPANSIGGMGGGFDEALCTLFNPTEEVIKTGTSNAVESWIRRYLHHGYTPLGTAHVVEFSDFPQFRHSKAWTQLRANSIVVVPTMRVPHSIYTVKEGDSEDVVDTKNRGVVSFVFDCMWEALCAVNRYNARLGMQDHVPVKADLAGKVDTLVIPGLGTGYGNLPIELVAKGMVGALTIWGAELNQPSRETSNVDRGLLCLAFLGEDYTLFHNPDILKSRNAMFGDSHRRFDILHQDVGDFYRLVE